MPYNALKYPKICDIHDLSWFNQYQYFPIYWIEFPVELNFFWKFLNWIFFWIEFVWKFLNWIIFWIEFLWKILNWIIFWIEFSWNIIELNIELNHFLAKFKYWIESIWVSFTPTMPMPCCARLQSLMLQSSPIWSGLELPMPRNHLSDSQPWRSRWNRK